MAIEIKVPTLGESVSEATVAKWLKKVGDAVKADEAVVELETDKVTLEVNAPAAGTLTDIVAAEGVTVGVAALLGVIGGDGSAKPVAAPAAAAAAPAPAPVSAPAAAAPAAHAPLPSAAKLIAENNLAASAIAGSGKDGRVTKGDVLDALAAKVGGAAPAPVAASASAPVAAGPREERVRMTRLRKRIAERLKQAQNTAAILTTFNEVDMTAAMAFRTQYNEAFEKKHGVKLGFMSIFVKACLAALKELPAVNAEIDGDEIVYKNFYDIGVAVGTEQGLVVPVLRDADQLGFADIEKKIAELGKRARDGKLSLDELQGGTFTISNGGVYGSLLSTPILNTPQSGILGMHKIQKRPMVISDKSGDRIEIRPMMYLALSYDHRIIDGREAVTFLVKVKDLIEDPRRLLFDV
ncbi:2-oxoglutarate dehydrogenase complex dihydrolipoyllysine-residue succinyltransferase [Elstera cyanobacteriorum]|uniref:2-oxoglutarate dehydrogenase complex dihydrolipoyllysine-residue succinyltransferase n=1 Tax=Elstera cyanobacteriorum TaxID=2022747 RepID=UPI0023537642|nr:2-oxoglutarate dehydrogenase complex dihydrolipoyllysine-residue succinyltransferase [Elstera cyanobacteriorum]MCK6443269.1 2-oxoglutarate dehydrogenase complex dihydrolipoyllysine-residue succinyltransferase [Elstera cyanobacteriorum]